MIRYLYAPPLNVGIEFVFCDSGWLFHDLRFFNVAFRYLSLQGGDKCSASERFGLLWNGSWLSSPQLLDHAVHFGGGDVELIGDAFQRHVALVSSGWVQIPVAEQLYQFERFGWALLHWRIYSIIYCLNYNYSCWIQSEINIGFLQKRCMLLSTYFSIFCRKCAIIIKNSDNF